MKRTLSCYLFTLSFCAAPILAQEPGQVQDTEGTQPYVARAQFTTAVVNREPVDQVVVISPPLEEVFFFSDVRHMEGETVHHNWRYDGELVSRVSFEVGGPRWRVYSKTRFEPGQFGTWSVTVTDGSGWPLYTELFRYESAGAATGVPTQGMHTPE
ncbi:MAG: DUF2914 domain-containing protein [Gammaproteobacteria bacterium]